MHHGRNSLFTVDAFAYAASIDVLMAIYVHEVLHAFVLLFSVLDAAI